MTSAKRGEDPGSATCENPVADHYALGRNLGITGTPALVLDSGQVVPGYVPADRLLAALEEARSQAAR